VLAARPELLSPPSADGDDEESSGLAIVQIDPREYETLRDLGGLREVRQKRYGNTLLVFYERDRPPVPE
jgi:16S rRNA (guanine966-N2)-methyltransferase